MKSFLLAVTSLISIGCAGQHDTLIRAMNATAASVNASSEFMVEACDARERSAIDHARNGADAVAALEEVRTHCDRIFAAFDTLRVTHDAARVAVEHGDDGAGAILLRLAGQWRELQALVVEWRRVR